MTKKQDLVLNYIKQYHEEYGYSPSLQEIQKEFTLASVSTAHYYIKKLQTNGYLSKEASQHRSINIKPMLSIVKIPILGTIAAGPANEAIEVLDGYITVFENEIKLPSECYALRAEGTSMIEDGVFDGDIVIIRKKYTAEDGAMVVAIIDDNQTTLKRIYREKNRVRLQPANQALLPFYRNEVEIRGVVEKIIRNPNIKIIKDDRVAIDKKSITNILQKKQNLKKAPERITLYHGDALYVLKTQITNSVDMIYLDPPFATGRDFKFEANSKKIQFSDKWGQNSYEEWLDELIIELKRVLKKDGNLFFHISAELSAVPHKVLHQHFKKVEPIFWKKAHGKNTVKNKLGSVVDIIFKASQDKSYFKLVYEPLDEFYFENSYRNKDRVGLYALGSLVHDKTRSGHKYTVEHNGINYETLYGWKKSKVEILKLISEDKIHFGKSTSGKPPRLYKKLYKHECKGKPLSNLWTDIAYITRNEQDIRLYPTQKPVALLKRLIDIGCPSNGIVLDPVAGSGTTGAAALQIGVSAILIDKNKEAVEIIRSRLKV